MAREYVLIPCRRSAHTSTALHGNGKFVGHEHVRGLIRGTCSRPMSLGYFARRVLREQDTFGLRDYHLRPTDSPPVGLPSPPLSGVL